MPELKNSQRVTLQACPTPIRQQRGDQENDRKTDDLQRVWQKMWLITSLEASPSELRQLLPVNSTYPADSTGDSASRPESHSGLEDDHHTSDVQAEGTLLSTPTKPFTIDYSKTESVKFPERIKQQDPSAVWLHVVEDRAKGCPFDHLTSVAALDGTALITAATALVDRREMRLRKALLDLLAVKPSDSPQGGTTQADDRHAPEPVVSAPDSSSNRDALKEDVDRSPGSELPRKRRAIKEGRQTSRHFFAARERRPLEVAARTPAVSSGQPVLVKSLFDAARTSAADDSEVVSQLLNVYRPYIKGEIPRAPYQLEPILTANLQRQRQLINLFRQQLQIEPVGMLHLERLAFTPAGTELGELVYSLPLAPGEEVNLTHREWSNTSEEFSKIVTDELEAFSEEGVTEKSELTQATASERQHANGYNLGVNASGTYGPVTIATSVGYNVQDSSSTSEQVSRTHTQEITRKASTRAKTEHKISFRLTTAKETEDQTIRKIINPYPKRPTRVDFHRLIRKWQVDLHRYGLRMTYDIVVPDPGAALVALIRELQALEAALAEPFAGSDSRSEQATFPLKPTDLDRSNYLNTAAQYSATVEAPPPPSISVVTSQSQNWATEDEAKTWSYFTVDFSVDERYEVSSVPATHQISWFHGSGAAEGGFLDIAGVPFPDYLIGRSGKMSVPHQARHCKGVFVLIQVDATLKDSAFKAWQAKAWNTIREAALARYYEWRQGLKGRLEALQLRLASDDALSLRQIEREEVMRSVLKWLFGPIFTVEPPYTSAAHSAPDDPTVSSTVWGDMLAYGDIVRFVHHAVEWENMLYIIYPYFWSEPDGWKLRRTTRHHDKLHQAFLRAGSARVVLTIRPGFEQAFAAFMETGSWNTPLGAQHPYVKITTEMENYAKTNYPGIPPANPEMTSRPLLLPLQRRAWTEMSQIVVLLDAYYAAHQAYPTTAQGLGVLAPFAANAGIARMPMHDPWSRPYRYVSPGVLADYELSSMGKDGKAGGEDENADIVSWAESSLIGRWYEYTPTSAMDVRFDQALPVN